MDFAMTLALSLILGFLCTLPLILSGFLARLIHALLSFIGFSFLALLFLLSPVLGLGLVAGIVSLVVLVRGLNYLLVILPARWVLSSTTEQRFDADPSLTASLSTYDAKVATRRLWAHSALGDRLTFDSEARQAAAFLESARWAGRPVGIGRKALDRLHQSIRLGGDELDRL